MGTMTIEEKASAYDRAIEKAKDMVKYNKLSKDDMEYLFPGFEECENERIRNMLISHLYRARGSLTNDEAGECIEWLKKAKTT